MKKLLIVLAILLVAGAGAFAQEVSVGGAAEAGFSASITNSAVTGKAPKAEININGTMSDNTSIFIQLDNAEGAPFDPAVLIDEWVVTSNIFGELGLDLPVSVQLQFGTWESYFSNFSYVTARGKPFWATTNWSFLGGAQPNENLAWEWNIGFGDFGLRYWNSWNFGLMSVGFYGSVANMVSFIVGFAGDYAALDAGALRAEVNANIDLGMADLRIPGSFTYNLGTQAVGWSTGVKVGIMDMVSVAVDVGGDTATEAFEYIIPQITATPLDGLTIYADAVVQLPTDAFKSIDLGASYMVGPLKVNPGFVIALDDTYSTALREDGGFAVDGTGFYVNFATSF